MDSRLMVHRPAVRALCGVHARVGDLAKHGSRDRPADWQQDNKQQQERKANSFHGQQVSTHRGQRPVGHRVRAQTISSLPESSELIRRTCRNAHFSYSSGLAVLQPRVYTNVYGFSPSHAVRRQKELNHGLVVPVQRCRHHRRSRGDVSLHGLGARRRSPSRPLGA